ncbi:hypothetical protein KFL_003590110 [Klebsormidium nitens]|uniref:GDT1 family protein n=1 Tax=Klebsormidium nitens TaxID=105231 RepID=A0A1Y1IFM9_KLENI|nr:hypothetical protein KFL_003590110 [Klebsormidium nitens]|eukprot:GAQ87537.1 hypothetical protein KFL_003590110 [Klebsormidium nitens]
MDALLSTEGFLEGFGKATSMIIFSEIGDKTFFIAALMGMAHPFHIIFLGCGGALWIMTLLSVALGWAAPTLIPADVTHYLATVLFFGFGLKSLYDAFTGEGESGELAEVEELVGGNSKAVKIGKENGEEKSKEKPLLRSMFWFLSPVFLKAFSLTFFGEWGDRSQIATIGLAAQDSPLGVAAGGCLGHALCTGAAILGGRHLASRISEKMVGICGGMLFLAFGVHELLQGVETTK